MLCLNTTLMLWFYQFFFRYSKALGWRWVVVSYDKWNYFQECAILHKVQFNYSWSKGNDTVKYSLIGISEWSRVFIFRLERKELMVNPMQLFEKSEEVQILKYAKHITTDPIMESCWVLIIQEEQSILGIRYLSSEETKWEILPWLQCV